MGVRIVIPSYLQPYAGNQASVEVKGSSVRECLDNLAEQFPDIERMLLAENGELLSYVAVYVNGKDAYPEELARAVKDGDEVHLLYIIGGG
ncbi:MAG: MoaD/ThiS family protein [Dehalococcoidales bacterium]|nr:MoaD/ThiS family protein [Dehalococcoidales bacterium]